VHALLDAPGASCIMQGLYRMSGAQHIDNDINIDHAKPSATSRVYYKGILDGQSKAVFSGRVLVRKDAQKTNALQHDKNLILSRGAEIFTKPSLEIFADDVKCFHGAAAGEMSEDALFYLQARGIRKDDAVQMLIHAFATEIIDTVQEPWLKEYMDSLFTKGMPGRPIVTDTTQDLVRES
jgi:Fe-S cluster assembly protein SufD